MDEELKLTLLQYPELLLSPDYDKDDNNKQFHHFAHALQIGFDIPYNLGDARASPMTGIMHDITNLDLLWRPETKERSVNYYHWMTRDTREREPIWSMYSYLFEKYDPWHYDEFSLTEKEKQALKEFYKFIKNKYQTAEAYVARISACFHLSGYHPIDVAHIHTVAFA